MAILDIQYAKPFYLTNTTWSQDIQIANGNDKTFDSYGNCRRHYDEIGRVDCHWYLVGKILAENGNKMMTKREIAEKFPDNRAFYCPDWWSTYMNDSFLQKYRFGRTWKYKLSSWGLNRVIKLMDDYERLAGEADAKIKYRNENLDKILKDRKNSKLRSKIEGICKEEDLA